MAQPFIDWALYQFFNVVMCSFNTAVALGTNQLIQVRCPSLEYCNAWVLPGALQICYKWASGTHISSILIQRLRSSTVNPLSTSSSPVHAQLSASTLHACMCEMREYKCVCEIHTVPPPPPLRRGVGRKRTPSTHSLGLCSSSRSDLH